ncbi:hypothetical protein [Pseudomonas sp. PDM25]|uniref:hypothetical protein n=1 Tax=Pseudomonas sp. PDM25 TaxID=2854772 RepID=UPI001C48167A|nr:hypothetical protein [Pseudomonas sp. PDM25]MBV7514579.1 hypothetical protein [Pseudomonas sp. PDM25]
MRDSKTVLRVAVTMLMASGVHAATLDIPVGTVADCIPFPSIEAIKSASIFQGENPALVQLMTCEVIKGQPLPAQSKLVGEVRAGSNLGPYSIVWQRLQLTGAQGVLEWNPADEDFVSSRIQDAGHLRVTFKRGLSVSPDSSSKP